jgi:hypothetical protein
MINLNNKLNSLNKKLFFYKCDFIIINQSGNWQNIADPFNIQ